MDKKKEESLFVTFRLAKSIERYDIFLRKIFTICYSKTMLKAASMMEYNLKKLMEIRMAGYQRQRFRTYVSICLSKNMSDGKIETGTSGFEYKDKRIYLKSKLIEKNIFITTPKTTALLKAAVPVAVLILLFADLLCNSVC